MSEEEKKLSEWCKSCTSADFWCAECYKIIEKEGLNPWSDPVVTEGELPGYGES